MNEIKCPNCGTIFQIDESHYYELLKQVKNTERNRMTVHSLKKN